MSFDTGNDRGILEFGWEKIRKGEVENGRSSVVGEVPRSLGRAEDLLGIGETRGLFRFKDVGFQRSETLVA